MKILLGVHHPLDPGAGAAGVVWQVGQGMAALGHDVDYFSWDDLPASLPARAKELLFPEFAALRFAQARKSGVDVIETSTGDAWLWGKLRPDRRPLMVTRSQGLEHSYSRARKRRSNVSGERPGILACLYHDRLRLREVRYSLRKSDVTLFGNSADREEAVRRFGVEGASAHVVANGIAEELLGLRSPTPPVGRSITIVQLGTFDPRKGSDVTLAALELVLTARPESRMLMLGTGTPGSRIYSQISASLHSRVTVVPRYERAELAEMLLDAQILVHPSLAEGFSLALLEGMACGLAPVASSVGSAPDLFGRGGPGLLVPPGDAPALAAALLSLIDNPTNLLRLRTAAHARAQSFTWRAAAESTIAAYETGLARLKTNAAVR